MARYVGHESNQTSTNIWHSTWHLSSAVAAYPKTQPEMSDQNNVDSTSNQPKIH